ncbi:MAG: hypothetical protein AB2A00_28595 [Myxococcota bacterium]
MRNTSADDIPVQMTECHTSQANGPAITGMSDFENNPPSDLTSATPQVVLAFQKRLAAHPEQSNTGIFLSTSTTPFDLTAADGVPVNFNMPDTGIPPGCRDFFGGVDGDYVEVSGHYLLPMMQAIPGCW